VKLRKSPGEQLPHLFSLHLSLGTELTLLVSFLPAATPQVRVEYCYAEDRCGLLCNKSLSVFFSSQRPPSERVGIDIRIQRTLACVRGGALHANRASPAPCLGRCTASIYPYFGMPSRDGERFWISVQHFLRGGVEFLHSAEREQRVRARSIRCSCMLE